MTSRTIPLEDSTLAYKEVQPTAHPHWKVAYTIQNVGLDLNHRVGDVVPVRNTLDGLQKRGHEVHVFELHGRQITRAENAGNIGDKHPMPLKWSGKRPFLWAESAVRRLQQMVGLPYFAIFDTLRFYEVGVNTFSDYDLCHEHNGLFSPATAMACRKLNKPYILTFSADPILEAAYVNRPLTGIHRTVAEKQARFTYQLADQIICVSNQAKAHLASKWQVDPQKINVMPNGVDVDLFSQQFDPHPVRKEWRLGEGPVICFVGGFQKWHGLENLVDSFKTVSQSMPETRLLLVGDGPYREELDQKIAASGVQEKVIVTGFLPQERVPELMAAADIAVLPYPELPQDLWFSPLKLYEYMAAGKTVVASRAGQIAEVISDGETGILIKPGDVGALTNALLGLLNNEPERRRLAENGRLQAVKHHSWANYITRLETIYAKAIRR